MPRTPILPVRVDEETKARWTTAAKAAGLSVAEFVRDAVNEKLGRAALVSGSVVTRREQDVEAKSQPSGDGISSASSSRPAPTAPTVGTKKTFRPDFGTKLKA